MVEERGLRTLHGGRFLHVSGQTDKGTPLGHFRKKEVAIIALGDRPNDLAMLKIADIGVIIASKGDYVLEAEGVLRSTQIGPLGWAEMMTQILDQFQIPHLTILTETNDV